MFQGVSSAPERHRILQWLKQPEHLFSYHNRFEALLVKQFGDCDLVGPLMEEEPLINKILLHLRHHISDPDKLRIDHLAGTFHLSANYVGYYFRKFTGESSSVRYPI